MSDPGPNPVQAATLSLGRLEYTGIDDPILVSPNTAPVFVVDDDTTTTPFGFGRSTYSRQETFTLGIPVFRSGDALGSAAINFATSPGDGNPIEGEDYEIVTESPLEFGDGDRVKVIEIRMLKDSNSEGDEQFTVTLEGGEASAETGTTDVTIDNLSPSEAELRPTGRLHHPRHEYKYPQNYPWLNEIHIFTASADRDLRVTRAEMSIVKKLKGGACRWWNGKRFVNQRCIDRRWFDEGIKKPAKDYFLHRLKQRLPVSVGKKSNVAYYEIRARWWDNENHVSTLRVGANKNRFDVIKPTKACRDHPFNFRKCKPVRP